MKKAYLGGESLFSPFIFFQKPAFQIESYLEGLYPSRHRIMTGGGLFSLKMILKAIHPGPKEIVLLPSYICPSLLIPFQQAHVRYDFYKIDSRLEIDIDHLKKITLKTPKALLFINYFGFPHSSQAREILIDLQKNGVCLIEDAVHSFFSQFVNLGDFVFNSFRKLLPMDGSAIISHRAIPTGRQTYPKYLFYKSSGQVLRFLHYALGLRGERIFLSLLKKAEKVYYEYDDVRFSSWARLLLAKTDIGYQKSMRRKNYDLLLSMFRDRAVIPFLPAEVVPFGFPIRVKNRNEVRETLMSRHIYCPVHWKLPSEISASTFPESVQLSEQILTIPLSQNLEEKEAFRLIETIKESVK